MPVEPQKKLVTPKSERTFERVLNVSAELFQTKGFHETTMRDISRESKLGLGALYYYCRSKEELVLLFYERINEQIFEEYQRSGQKQKTLAEAFEDFLRLKMRVLSPFRKLLIVVLKESVDPDSKISPLNSDATKTREKSIQFFEALATRYSKAGKDLKEVESTSAETAKLLWLVHMGILAFWLYDKTPDFAKTEKLIAAVVNASKWAGKLNAIPGFNTVSRQLIGTLMSVIH